MFPLAWPQTWPAYDGVVLRPFAATDVAMLQDLATDPYVPLIGTLAPRASEAEASEFIRRQHDRLETGVGFSFCVADAGTGAALGTAGLWVSHVPDTGRASVGYTVAPRSRRRGVAVRALTALTGFAWTLAAVRELEAYVEPWNVGSIRTLEAVRFRRQGLRRAHQEIGGRPTDLLHFLLRRSDRHQPEAQPGRGSPGLG